MTMANWVTVLRIVLIPFFVSSLIYRRMDLALGAFLLAMFSDALDGFLARRTRITTLGRFLDPAADKLLLVSAYILLPIVDQVPVWVSVVVVSRDVVIALGYWLIYITFNSTELGVRWLGKASTVFQMAGVIIVLLAKLVPGLGTFQTWLIYAVALVTAVSGIDYILVGIQFANQRSVKVKSKK